MNPPCRRTKPMMTKFITMQITSSFQLLTHREELLPPRRCQFEPSSRLCVSPLTTLWAKKTVTIITYHRRALDCFFASDLRLPPHKGEAAAISTTLSLSSPSASSPADTTSMTSVGLLPSLWFWPRSGASARRTPCDHNHQKP